ncbi:MAG: outer membrane protein assembly factor BamE [Pseudomonadota bacterium]
MTKLTHGLAALMFALAVGACAPAGTGDAATGSLVARAEQVQVGMTREEVLALMGRPNDGRTENRDGSGRWGYTSDPAGLGGLAVGQAAGLIPGLGGVAAGTAGRRAVQAARTRVGIRFDPDGTVARVTVRTG